MNQSHLSSQPRRVLQVTDNHSPGHPGVTAVVTQIARYLGRQGWPVTILAAGQAEGELPPSVELEEFPLLWGGNFWRYTPDFVRYLEKAAGSGDILHLHGVWGAPQWQAARFAAHRGLPALLSPHDMLSPWHWRDGRLRPLKKRLYWWMLAYPAFRRLSLVHAITVPERDALARQFPGIRLEVIPNVIDLEEADAALATPAESLEAMEEPYLLFLSRLHPKKGIDLLLGAFARARNRGNRRLLIVGPDWSAAYTAGLKDLARSLGLEGRVRFPGPVFGAGKWQLYRQAQALCLPSRSEVVGLVNLEAAAARKPVITTHETGLLDWEQGGGLLVHPRLEELTGALETVFSWTESERESRGQALRQLVERRYSWEAVGPRWLELYGAL